MVRKLIPILFMFRLDLVCSGADWYVDDTNGLDTNAGTSWGASWKTIPYTWSAARAGNKIAEGDTIYFKAGNYGAFSETTTVATDIRNRAD